MDSKTTAGEQFLSAGLGREELVRLALDMLHQTMVHHVFWFKEAQHQFGFEKALAIMGEVYEKNLTLQMHRLGKTLDFKVKGGLPEAFLELPPERLGELIRAFSLNWLATDGLWFQEVEARQGMLDAKRCNDSCWVWFAQFEAWSIKRRIRLSENPGLDGLKQALRLRMYAAINRQTIVEGPDSISLYNNDCRVQSARKDKGMEDYPCKSAGLQEYSNFASAIDERITTRCLACPPDGHPPEWFCGWEFRLREGTGE